MTNNSYSAMANSPPLFAQNLPVGWRFGPTDQELVAHYLKRKRRGDPIDGSDIVEVIKFCNYNPWDLPGLSKCKSTDKEWFFFFYLREYHNNSGQAKRRAGNGYWKITGDPRSVTPEESDEEIGTKRTLVFHNPEATCWGNYVLCKLKEKPNKKKKAVKRSKKVEPSCQKSRAKKKARKGESDCNMASVSASAFKRSKEIMANSTYVEGEPSISNHMISGLGNQNSKKMAAIATYEKDGSSNPKALGFDNESQCEMISISTCNKGETSSIIASSLRNQNFSEMTDVSSHNRGETRCLTASSLENYNPNENTATSSYKNCKQSCPTASGLENQNSNEITNESSYFANQNANEMTNESFYFANEMTNKSFYDIGKPSNLDPLDFEKQNPSKSTGTSSSTEGVWSSLLKSPDFDNQNQSEKTDLSPLKYDRSSYIASNVGETTFQEAQSQYKGTDVPTPNYQNSMLTSNSQEAMLQNQYDITEKPILEDNFTWMASDGREAKFPEINPQLLDELIAYYELQDSLNSASEQPIHTKES
ncbi:hypothetical protein JCGZ_14160 [Jatropha curcas]|uniref:NAC domain-containing protein n=1 Tax=Jatropha curcas TaxID=180498 RepID=A0A067K998_JATCU|nr:hypothetical protein JCGZ_14160 [Jatropha curcas]